MFAAHFAAGLAIKSRVPNAPTAAILAGAFVPDFLWIGFATAGLEPTQPERFFDDWSHSLLMVVVWACIYAAFFWKRGRGVVIAMWLAVFSHFILDAPIHPKPPALYPHSSMHFGWATSEVGLWRYWEVQLAVVAVLGTVYVIGAWRAGLSKANIVKTCLALLGLHVLTMPVG